ncbi:MAG TPA: VOC family protein, partial [Anaerolineaceae bacterium]|nr:VOC family protein [Anaerolineaceae bacterium]
EGLPLALIDDGGAPGGIPWLGSPVPVAMGIRGLHGVRLLVQDAALLIEVLSQVMGFERLGSHPVDGRNGSSVDILITGEGGPGTEVQVESDPRLPVGQVGIGSVHHVAFRTPNADEQLQWRERLFKAGLKVTDVIDRFYFKSIYFRVPGGILFEIATDGPGFAMDEDEEHLGEQLSLPPFLEPQRAHIESLLKPLEV